MISARSTDNRRHRQRFAILGLEVLEGRLPLAGAVLSAICNLFNQFDVDDDLVSGTDALFIINELNSPLESSAMPGTNETVTTYLDSDDDEHVTPTDALLIINHLNFYNDTKPALVFG